MEEVKKGCTRICVVLDRSGSMLPCKAATLSGLNEYIQQLKSDCLDKGSPETYVSLVSFNSKPEELYWNQSINYLNEFSEHDYMPTGWTAMWDAVGYAINKLKSTSDHTDKDNDYFVLIVSDGEENRSTLFTCLDEKQEKVWMNANKLPERTGLPGLIDECQATKRWTFVYLGANHDLSVVQKQMHLPHSNMARYSATPRGHGAAWSKAATQMQDYMAEKAVLCSAPAAAKGFGTVNFFNKEDKVEDLTIKPQKEKPWNQLIIEAARKNQEKWESNV